MKISNAVTHIFPCARSLLDFARSLRNEPFPPNATLLFALAPSPSTPPDVLSCVASTLTQVCPRHVGCISAPLPYQYLDQRTRGVPYACSLAYAFVNGVPFRSTIPGRVETYVGRRHASRNRASGDVARATQPDFDDAQILGARSGSDGKVDWEHVWGRSTPTSLVRSLSVPASSFWSEILPDELSDIDPLAVSNVLCFSDKAPEGLAAILQDAFPQANKLSLIASSTPFVTGRPVTLFYNGSIFSNGAVGITFTSPPSVHSTLVDVSFPPLVALSRNLTVTSSEGNMILSLDSGSPTQLLLGAVRKHGLSSSDVTWVGKEDEFYVGAVDPSSRRVFQLYRINAGDPSRGSIVLDSASAPREGSIVCLYHLPRNSAPDVLAYVPSDTSNTISLFVTPEVVANSPDDVADGPVADRKHSVLSNIFLVASENGFTLSLGEVQPWKCVTPGGQVRLSL